MFDYQEFRIMHRHGSNWAELRPSQHHDPAEHDPERAWDRGAQIYKCEQCDEKVTLIPGDATERPSKGR